MSLTAGESARRAISTSWSTPKATSWVRVRWGPGGLGAGQVPSYPLGRLGWPHAGQLAAFDEEMSRAIRQPDDSVGLSGDSDQRPVADVLQIATLRGADHGSGGVDLVEQLVGRGGVRWRIGGRPRPVGALNCHCLGQVLGDAGDHLRQLDLRGDVVNEVDEHREIKQDQPERGRNGDVRDEFASRAWSDRNQGDNAVDERRHERPERQLRTAIPDEVTQHAWTELGRGQRQCHDRDRKDDAHDRDHRRRDRCQDLARRIGGSTDDPARWAQATVVGGSVQAQRDREQPDRRDHFDGWQQATDWCAAASLCHCDTTAGGAIGSSRSAAADGLIATADNPTEVLCRAQDRWLPHGGAMPASIRPRKGFRTPARMDTVYSST